jgi:hypothetical protein
MTQKQTRSPRAALLIGAALLATPAFAQDQSVTPPPVVSTVPQAAPAPAPAPAPATAPEVTFAPAAPTVQTVPDVPKAQTPPRTAATRTATRSTSTTTTARQTTRAPAPAAEAPAPQPGAPVAQPAEQPAPVAATPPETTPAAPVQADTTTTTTTESTPRQNALWPWLLGGALIVAGVIAALLFRRRTEYDEVYEETYEPAYAEPAAVTDPIFAKPEPVIAPMVTQEELAEPVAIAEDAEIVKAEAGDVADLTAAAPHSKRPWLEFGMRPVRAGTSSDEALVELELTVANSGDMPAKDVRISTFMLKDADAGDMERMLTEHESTVPPVTIAAGQGTRVDATIAVRKDEVAAQGENFSPVVVADARYTMADGTEGRTSAAFRVGLWNDGDGIEPIGIGRPQMHDNVAAELHGVPEHA